MFRSSAASPRRMRPMDRVSGTTLRESFESYPSAGDAARRGRYFNFTRFRAGKQFTDSSRNFRSIVADASDTDFGYIDSSLDSTGVSPTEFGGSRDFGRSRDFATDGVTADRFDLEEFRKYNRVLFVTHMATVVSGMFQYRLLRKPVRDGLMQMLHVSRVSDHDEAMIKALGCVYCDYVTTGDTSALSQGLLKIYYSYA